MPFWLMFIPVVAIVQGIIVLFVAFGQWVTGTYYTMESIDGGRGGRIEIFRDVAPDGSMRIEARLEDGHVFATSFEQRSRRAIVRGLPSRRSPNRATEAIPVELVSAGGDKLACFFTRSDERDAGGCTTSDGRVFRLVAHAESLDAPSAPPG